MRSLTPLACLLALPLVAQGARPDVRPTLEAMGDLPLRSLGPALTSGRIGDLAVHPTHKATWYVAVASGGVWKTVNAGTTWTPIFDRQGSYSIGCVTVDPNRPETIWVGTGEQRNQRSVGYGDGLYRSQDGGRTWTHMGLKTSEHLAKVIVDPRNSDVVLVAAQGPLWKAGGERGLYRTTDGGKTWKAVLTVDEHTGVTDVVMDPRNPDILVAATHQRRRHVWGIVHGGPGSALWKSTDGGLTWRKLATGLPGEELGRIGLAFSPVQPGLVYAAVEAANQAGGLFRSLDGGESWEKRSGFHSGSTQYYQRLIADPRVADRLYATDVFLQVSEDGGKTWKQAGEKHKHVDNHALWIDPENPDHLLNGNDGGLYETWDRCATWHFKANLPVPQFYRVAVDNARPFYTIYGGTQDNYSLGGPSRTRAIHGAANSDWFVTLSADGMGQACDPEDPNTVYSSMQYGGLIRFDRTTGEKVSIQPQPAPGEAPYRWNWDTPFLVSPHHSKRLYLAANKVFRSDDRGESWKVISPDLSRQLNRDTFRMMDRVWGIDALSRHVSTSFYGNGTALTESPKVEGLLYLGTDDGLVQVSEDAGGAWRRIERFPGVPERAYVSSLAASPHQPDTVYAAFNHHKEGDFRPYALRSRDRGRTWEAIAGNLPERGSVYVLKEDPVRPGLLYCGTEFGAFFSLDGGASWTRFRRLPTIAVRDLVVHPREGDLVLATFGRGIYVLDDLTPLREAAATQERAAAHLYGLRPALSHVPSVPYGGTGPGFQGASHFLAENPPFGAVFTYVVNEAPRTLKRQRQAAEKEAMKAGRDVTIPSFEALKQEDWEQAPAAVLTITDAQGQAVARVQGPASQGLHRVAWDLRRPAVSPVDLRAGGERSVWDYGIRSPLAAPGTYRATLSLRQDGLWKEVAAPVTFEVKPLDEGRPWSERAAFEARGEAVLRDSGAAGRQLAEAQGRLEHVRKAVQDWPGADPALAGRVRALDHALKELGLTLQGDSVRASRQAPTVPSLSGRARAGASATWSTTQRPTAGQIQDLAWAEEGLKAWRADFGKALTELKALEAALDACGAPHTPGRGL